MARIFTDGGAGVLQSDNQSFLDLDSFSVAFWMFRTGTPAAERGILSADDGNVDSGWFLSLTTGNLIRAARVFSTATASRLSSTAPALNTWVHVLVTCNFTGTGTANTDFTFYFNGKAEAGTSSATGSGTHVRQAVPFKIGASGGGLAGPYQIGDPVPVWSRALSPAEALALASGAHPSRFREGLIEGFDLVSASHEEGWQAKLLLVPGSTNPPNTAVSPPVEPWPLLVLETRQNVRPFQRSRARYSANGTGPISFNPTPVIQSWLVAASILAAAVGLSATPVTQSWNVPGGSLAAARTLAPTPVTQSWSVPAAAIATARTLSATPVIQTWNVPATALSAARSLASTPVIQTWSVPGGSVFISGGSVAFNPTPVIQTWAVPAAVLSAARGLAATPAIQTWSVPGASRTTARSLGALPVTQSWVVLSAGISNPGVNTTLNATPVIQNWVVPAAILITDTWTMQFAGGPVLSAAISGGGVLIASVSGGPAISTTVSGGPV